MAINLRQLEQAAARYQEHRAATERADPDTTLRENAAAAKRHRELFIPASEQLLNLKSSSGALVAVSELDPAATMARALMTIEDDLGD